MHRGHIKLWRRLKDNELWKSEPFSRGQAWIDLLLLANFEPGQIRVRGNIVPIKRGQVGWSILSLSDRWKWSRGKVERFLTELESTQQIVQQKKRLTSVIIIVNYDEYQKRGATERATDNTTDSTTDGQQTDTKKNDKNDKNKPIALYSIPEKVFHWFWKEYSLAEGRGKQGNKLKTKARILSSVKNDKDSKFFYYATKAYLQMYDERHGDDDPTLKFMKHPEVFANEWRGYIPEDAEARYQFHVEKTNATINARHK